MIYRLNPLFTDYIYIYTAPMIETSKNRDI